MQPAFVMLVHLWIHIATRLQASAVAGLFCKEELVQGNVSQVPQGINVNQVPQGINVNQVPQGINVNQVPQGINVNQVPQGINVNQVPQGIILGRSYHVFRSCRNPSMFLTLKSTKRSPIF